MANRFQKILSIALNVRQLRKKMNFLLQVMLVSRVLIKEQESTTKKESKTNSGEKSKIAKEGRDSENQNKELLSIWETNAMIAVTNTLIAAMTFII